MDHPREVTDQLDFKGVIGGEPKRHLIEARRRFGSASRGFRTIQGCPKDLPGLLRQVERAVDRPAAPRREEARCPT
jgi:hypothetical protein